MNKNDIEKSLKHFLKRKVSYSLGLLVSFMITGGVAFADVSTISNQEIAERRESLMAKILEVKEKIEENILQNEKEIEKINISSRDLIKEADFYAKPIFPKYSFGIFAEHINRDNGKKKYFAGIRKDTENDDFRSEFNKAVQRKNENQGRITLASNFNSGNTEHLSSGWINMTEAYNKNKIGRAHV